LTTFEAWQTAGDARTPGLSPPRLRQRFGASLMRVLGAVKDAVADAARQAVKARMVALAPDDALPWIGAERLIERYPGETTPQYRARLRAAWDAWLFAGTAQGVVGALRAAGFNASVFSVRAAPSWWVGAWPPNGPEALPAASWSRFWIVIEPPFPFAWTLRRWGAFAWGELGADGTPLTWGSTATVRQVELVRSIVRKWKAAHERCAQVLVRVPDGAGGFVTLQWNGET
jgi:hypothetical protein